MRLKLFAALILIALIIVWAWPKSEPTAPKQSNLEPQTQSQSLSSNSTPQTPTAKVEPPIYIEKAVGAHLGKPILWRPNARNVGGIEGKDTSPMQRYQGLKRTKALSLNGRSFQILGARGVPTADYNNNFGPILFTQNGFSVVGLDTTADDSWLELVFHQSDRPLVVNPDNGQLGIVTGTFMVKLTDVNQAANIAGQTGMKLITVDESIQVAYFHVPENFHMLPASEMLQHMSGVESVEFEIVEGNKVAR